MKLKKVLCILTAAMMVMGMTACGGNGGTADNAGSTPETGTEDTGSAEDESAAADTAESGEAESEADTGADAAESTGATGTLKVAAVETAYGADMWTEVCAAFEESHEGVTVELTVDKKLEDVITPEMNIPM